MRTATFREGFISPLGWWNMTETDLERPCFLILQCKLISALITIPPVSPLPKIKAGKELWRIWVKDDPFKAWVFLNILSLGLVMSRHTGIGHSEVIIFGGTGITVFILILFSVFILSFQLINNLISFEFFKLHVFILEVSWFCCPFWLVLLEGNQKTPLKG